MDKNNASSSAVLSSNTSTSTPHFTNPLYDIEADIRDLMKRCGTLAHELSESQNNWESDTKKMIVGFIEVADAFENVFRNLGSRQDLVDEQTKIWINNFETVYKLLMRALENQSVTPIETMIGNKANPHWHNVVEAVRKPDLDNGTVVEEIRKGYLWRGKLLRAADIKAVSNK